METKTHLIEKYNVAGPRYTSYPTVPYWQETDFSLAKWKKNMLKSFNQSNHTQGISLYIHLPFCESLCTFCGCNKRITKRHDVEVPYITSINKEWQLYCDLFDTKPIIKEIHLGGGTPTFFNSENLKILIKEIFKRATAASDIALSFEGHPNNTTKLHLETLAKLGFNRVSFGVQDYNPTVQKAIHRIQPFEHVKNVTTWARELGYTSVGHDLIFGLPFQTTQDIINTIEKTKELLPDRIAFYSYAHVPWIKGNGQRGFKESDLPTAQQKREQYQIGKQLLQEVGYIEIGMDHFALPSDSLYNAMQTGNLHRNFMGYTHSKTQLMIGLGVSAIGDSWYAFGQNVKGLEAYQDLVNRGIFPIYRGHILTNEDLIIRRHILNIMCKMETFWNTKETYFKEISSVLERLEEFQKDGLVDLFPHRLKVTEKGRAFVRNICMAFDLRLQKNKPDTQLFSMTI
jgi:oxygen-independent coproporphyrinogen-3 oxidase